MAEDNCLLSAASQYKIKVTYAAVGSAAPTKLLGANPNRVALILNNNDGTVYFGTDSTVGNNVNSFWSASVQNNYLKLTFAEFGPFVQGEFWCLPISGVRQVSATEVIFVPTG